MCNIKKFLNFIGRYHDDKNTRRSSNPGETLKSTTNFLTPS